MVKKEQPQKHGTRRKHSIVLEERTKVLKAAAHEQRDVVAKQEVDLSSCCVKKAHTRIAKKTCKCLEDVDCEHMNFQVRRCEV